MTDHSTKANVPDIEEEGYVPGPEGLAILREAGIEMSINTYYQSLRDKGIPNIRIGSRYYVRKDVVRQMEG